jgi:predicted GNAT superfamily acetyltransferase
LWYSSTPTTLAETPFLLVQMPSLHAADPSKPEGRTAHASTLHIALRPIETLSEHRACVVLQREIWGDEFDEIVPASLMLAASHVGALSIGAYSGDGELVGFVFGLTGQKNGNAVHWSHMLGVRASMRDLGIGRGLKECQRSMLAARGITSMYWTFDPLQARNAHLNLNRLGARVIEYVADMYGASQSPLHHAIATDRVVVECSTGTDNDVRAPANVGAVDERVILTPYPRSGDVSSNGVFPSRALIEVPWDLQEVVADSPVKALEWRSATRHHFQWALQNRYAVMGLHRDSEARRAFFIIERSAEANP